MYGQASMERILCVTDSSTAAKGAVRLAVDIARAEDARILLLYVLAQPGGQELVPATCPVESPRLDLAGLLATIRASGVPAECVVLRRCDVAGAIVYRAESWPADIVVMGIRGGPGPADGGSVTAEVLRRAPCPLLIAGSSERDREGVPRAPVQRILCPTDFSDASREAFEYGALIARALAVRITPLHVLEWFLESGELSELHLPEYQMDVSQEARDRLMRSIPPHVRPFCSDIPYMALGRPHREILRVAREQDVGLIVLGVHDRRALDKVLGGSTARHVVREARCPVLIVRAGRVAAGSPAGPKDQDRRAS